MLKNKWYTLVGALLIVALMGSGTLAFAQDGTQTFMSDDGTLSFEYPADWIAEDFFGVILLANSEDTFNAIMGDAKQIAPGQVLILAVTPDNLAENADSFSFTPDLSLEDLAVVYATNVIGIENVGTPETATLGAYPVAHLDVSDEEGDVALYTIDFGDGKIGLLALLTATGERADYLSVAENIIAAMTYQAPPEATETAALVWQQVQPVDYEADDGYIGADAIVIGPDDTIYVLDSSVGIRVFNADGEPQSIIIPGDPFFKVAAFDLAPDGTFWGMDYWGTVGNFDADGTVLSSFDVTTTEIGEVAFAGLHLLVGPDGNLYILNPQNQDDDIALGVFYTVTPEGEVLGSFGLGTQDYSFDSYVDFGPDGNLYMISTYDNTGIAVYDTEGNMLREGVGRNVLQSAYFVGGLAVGEDGSIYTADSNSPVYHLANDGTLLGEFGQSYYDQEGTETDEAPQFPEGTFASISAVGVLSNGDMVVGDTTSNWWQLVRVNFSE